MPIAVVGSTMIDLVTYLDRLPEAGETLAGNDFAMGCGGKGANQAVAAARLGAEVTMVARVGNDDFGRIVLENLRSKHVDTTHVTVTEGTNGVAPIFVEPDGTNRVLIVKGANERLSPDDVTAAAEDLRRCDLIVLQLEVPLETVYAAVDLGAEHDIPVLLNPAPATTELDRAEVARCTFFVPNETELGMLTGKPVDTLEQVESAARELLRDGPENVIVTLGENGALWLTGEASDGVHVEHIPVAPVDAVDSTGAGDAFIGCFARVWSRDRDVRAALRSAVRYAADSVTRRGTQTSYADTCPGVADA